MTRKRSLSVILIVMDEADRVRPCLESVSGLADQIVVLDAGSTDGTADICREFSDDVHITGDWPGDGPQKQRALDRATGDWVLWIDADERVSPELRTEIETVLRREAIDETGFRIPWATWVFGRYLTRGDCGARHLKLFRREGARFTTPVVHARPIPAPGPTGRLRGRLYHASFRSLRHLLGKLADYACAPAEAAAGGASRADRPSLASAFLHAWARFLKTYVLRLGMLDGWRGLLIAVLYAQYTFDKYAARRVAGLPAMPTRDDA